jgi:CubicO group peptidase (beta-lactamase class C family)
MLAGTLLIAFLMNLLGLAADSVRQKLDRVLELNRGGDWVQAAELAETLLSAEKLEVGQQCEALALAAYARSLGGDHEQARKHIESFDLLTSLPEQHWARREVEALRERLEKPTTPGKADDQARGTHWNHRPLVEEDDFWKVAEPAKPGFAPKFLRVHRDLCIDGGADAILVVHEGQIVDEWYGPRYQGPCGAMSSTKSITSLLVGLLIQDGKLDGIDVTVSRFLPEWQDEARKDVTLRHLLSHTSGLTNRAAQGEMGVGGVGDKNGHVRSLHPDVAPGTTFSYSNEGVQLLSPILEAAAGEPLHLYAERRLFQPMGMRNSRLRVDEKGHAWTYGDMLTTPRDLARIGLLLLQTGRWNQKVQVKEPWIQESLQPSQDFNDRCGLLWWLYPESKAFAALGYLGTDLHLFPTRQLVIVRMQQKPGPDGNPGPAYREALHSLVRRHLEDE